MTALQTQTKTNCPTANAVVSPYTTQIRDLVYRVAGIFHSDTRLRFLEERCLRRMHEVGIDSLHRYYDLLTVNPDRTAELHQLLNEVTIGETCFFRNQPQIDALRKLVLPMIVANKARLPIKRLRLWSAGCSTGEEPYTLAMVCMEECATGVLKGFSFEILATDLNERSLARAQEGIYSEYAVRNTNPYFLNKYFRQQDGELWRVEDSVRECVKFSRVNLLDDTRMVFLKAMDAIFCCNVLIYFDGTSKRHVIQHFYNNLLPNSYFFLGHSESLFGINNDFRLVHFPGAVGYLKPAQRTVL